jgi:hypothetical protein
VLRNAYVAPGEDYCALSICAEGECPYALLKATEKWDGDLNPTA